jgi:mono/diheme cytochrome c family protein
VWRFDRVAWTAGREPWREIGPSETIAIRNPERAGTIIEGEMRSLCAGCHGPGASGRARAAAPRPQIDLVREALEDALGPAED